MNPIFAWTQCQGRPIKKGEVGLVVWAYKYNEPMCLLGKGEASLFVSVNWSVKLAAMGCGRSGGVSIP